jgi:hypothetical protein
MFGRRQAKPDAALLARVSEASDVDLGTYPEDALAVTGAYPTRGSLDRRPEGTSPFRRLDTHARQAAMQAALDRLIAERTVNLPAGSSLEKTVAAGLDGKLPVLGELGSLYGLGVWFRRHGFRSGMIVTLTPSEGLQGAPMPPGTAAPGVESCLALLPEGRNTSVLLVERADSEAGTRSYTLRTVRREFTRMAGFLFADVITPGQALRADADMIFRFGKRTLKLENNFVRTDEEKAIGRLITHGPKKQEPQYVKVSCSELIEVMTDRFDRGTARTL